MKPSKKQRLDTLLVDKGLAPTRTRAQSLIMEGVVYVDGQKVDKSGTLIKEGSSVSVKDTSLKYVSRGGLKLGGALEHFKVDTQDKIALDVGASTGGFTDCLLQNGVARVYAVDVGYGQLDYKLRNDSRVVVMEKINARHINEETLPETVDIIVIDVSFISLTKIIPPVIRLLKPKGVLIALIKPQFEVGKGEVGKGGIVRDEAKHAEVVEKITKLVSELNLAVSGVIPSPITGAQGNREFLISAVKTPQSGAAN